MPAPTELNHNSWPLRTAWGTEIFRLKPGEAQAISHDDGSGKPTKQNAFLYTGPGGIESISVSDHIIGKNGDIIHLLCVTKRRPLSLTPPDDDVEEDTEPVTGQFWELVRREDFDKKSPFIAAKPLQTKSPFFADTVAFVCSNKPERIESVRLVTLPGDGSLELHKIDCPSSGCVHLITNWAYKGTEEYITCVDTTSVGDTDAYKVLCGLKNGHVLIFTFGSRHSDEPDYLMKLTYPKDHIRCVSWMTGDIGVWFVVGTENGRVVISDSRRESNPEIASIDTVARPFVSITWPSDIQ